MRWLRRISAAIALLVASAAVALILFALLLPADGTQYILKLRGHFGGADELAARDGARSLIREIGLRNDRGEVVTAAWVRRPRALRPDYRVLITYAGANTGDAILNLIPEEDDVVVAAVQYPWRPPRTLMERARALYDIRQAAYRTVAGGMLTVDYLIRDEQLNPDRIVVLGASLGSIFATIHGAIDPRIAQVVLIHGGTTLPDTLDAGLRGRVPAWLQPLLVRIASIPVATFDPARYVARISPRKLLVIAARDDPRFPPQAVMAFFNRAGQPKELRWTKTGHVGVRDRQVVNAVIGEMNAYLNAGR